jgi:hypothetical protein
MRFVVFLDALDYLDVQEASNGWFKKLAKPYTPNVPRVTPNVISQIMTGKRQEDLEFARSTPYKKPRKRGLRNETILNYAADRKLKVFQFGIPLCATIELPPGNITTFDHFLGPQPIPPGLRFIQAKKDFQEGDQNNIFNAYVDEAITLFASIRNLARNGHFDVYFLGYQPFDAYTHWYDEKARRELIKLVEMELMQTSQDLSADILFFSDHGSTKKTHNFFLNLWLKEQGWLDYTVYYNLLDFHRPKGAKHLDTVPLSSPYVYINWDKTKFYTNDAFDAMIDATDNATTDDKQKLREQLMKTGYFDSVALKEESFDPEGKFYNEMPDVLPETSEGVSTSCNVHKNAKDGDTLENIRTGWHSRRGVYGCSDETLTTEVHGPADIYKLIQEFVDKEEPKKQEPVSEDPDQNAVFADLAELGYE